MVSKGTSQSKMDDLVAVGHQFRCVDSRSIWNKARENRRKDLRRSEQNVSGWWFQCWKTLFVRLTRQASFSCGRSFSDWLKEIPREIFCFYQTSLHTYTRINTGLQSADGPSGHRIMWKNTGDDPGNWNHHSALVLRPIIKMQALQRTEIGWEMMSAYVGPRHHTQWG